MSSFFVSTCHFLSNSAETLWTKKRSSYKICSIYRHVDAFAFLINLLRCEHFILKKLSEKFSGTNLYANLFNGSQLILKCISTVYSVFFSSIIMLANVCPSCRGLLIITGVLSVEPFGILAWKDELDFVCWLGDDQKDSRCVSDAVLWCRSCFC